MLRTLYGHGEPDGVYVLIDVEKPVGCTPDDADAMTYTHELYVDLHSGWIVYG
jgi:hypothetical protein